MGSNLKRAGVRLANLRKFFKSLALAGSGWRPVRPWGTPDLAVHLDMHRSHLVEVFCAHHSPKAL